MLYKEQVFHAEPRKYEEALNAKIEEIIKNKGFIVDTSEECIRTGNDYVRLTTITWKKIEGDKFTVSEDKEKQQELIKFINEKTDKGETYTYPFKVAVAHLDMLLKMDGK